MEITSEVIKRLREKTGAGMMDCKRALEASKGDIDAAIEYLRKKGAAVGQKRSDRSAKEGLIITRVTPDSKRGVAVEVNCETDFVGRSDDFVAFAGLVAETVLNGPRRSMRCPRSRPLRKDTRRTDERSSREWARSLEVRQFRDRGYPGSARSARTRTSEARSVLVEFADSYATAPMPSSAAMLPCRWP
jgi:translation elongation factor Ts